MARQPNRKSRIGSIIARSRGAIMAVGIFSGIVNILALTGSFYMLQVYDRVLTGRSLSTLVALSVLCLGLFALQALLEIIRTQVMSRIGARVERDLLQPVHDLVMRLPLAGRSPQDVTQPVRDMEAVRNFMSGQAPIAFLDLPWMPLYLVFIFILHPWLGWMAVGGMVILVILTLMTEFRMREPARLAAEASGRRYQAAEATRRNVESLRAMGFGHRAAARFFRASSDLFRATERATDVSGTLGSLSRVFRMILQSAMLGLGAWLVLKNQMTAGGIIACSIIAGRALAPVELAIANWRIFSAARQARQRLDELVTILENEVKPIDLPLPKDSVVVEGLTIAPPGARLPVLRNGRMVLKAGDAVAILGPSGAGKSSLVRGLVGAWHPLAGTVRLDGAPIEQYPGDKLGRIIGYLPQEVELFEGTIAENIARLDPEADEAAIIAAATAAQVHDLIVRLPDGYKTKVGEGGFNLSAGQRQRIGLARALFSDPFFIVLDEPNAHLDQEGDEALARAVKVIRERGGVVVVVSHRPSILESVNLAAYVADGEMKGFGPRDEVLSRMVGTAPGAAPSASAPAAAQGHHLQSVPMPRPQGAPPSPLTPASAIVPPAGAVQGPLASLVRAARPQRRPAPDATPVGAANDTGTKSEASS